MKYLASLAALAMLIVGASAADLYVPSQYTHIQSAINAAHNGDVVHVAAGTYFESITWNNTSLTLQGAGQGQSIIDGTQTAPNGCLNLANVPASARIDGFTIQNGNGGTAAYGGFGGGMYLTTSNLEVANCAFSNNTAYVGGGMYSFGSNPTVTDCSFTGNVAWAGGGMANDHGSNPIVHGCTFTNNAASFANAWAGGGMGCWDGSNAAVTNCTFTGNSSAGTGGGMYTNTSSPTVTNCNFSGNTVAYWGAGMDSVNSTAIVTGCIFANNTAGNGGGGSSAGGTAGPTIVNCLFIENTGGDGGAIENTSSGSLVTNCTVTGNTSLTGIGSGIHNFGGGTLTATNCILWGDVGAEFADNSCVVSYCDIQGGYSGVGNINSDPLFRNAPGGNLRLTSHSPCINSGSNAAVNSPTDLDGNTRIRFGIVDMGAYESLVNRIHIPPTPIGGHPHG